jgi:hypothetical protein
LQKLGIITFDTAPEQARAHFEEALRLCQLHLKGNYAFLLSHDPPGLCEFLDDERSLVQPPNSTAVLAALSEVMFRRVGAPAASTSVERLQLYTEALRAKENDVAFALAHQEECCQLFPASSDGGAYGITYLQSVLRVLQRGSVQQALGSATDGKPQLVALGSALGSACVWPAVACGITCHGFDLMPFAVTTATQLMEQVVPEEKKLVTFECADVLQDARVRAQLKKANVVWVNDFAWAKEDQTDLEQLVLNTAPVGTVVALYRPPRHDLAEGVGLCGARRWKHLEVVQIATSWNPTLDMYLLAVDE